MPKNEVEPVDFSVPTMPEADEPDEVVVYPAEGQSPETAQALLDAAESLDLDPTVVRTSDGAFIVPAEVADKAKLPEGDEVRDNLNATASENSDGKTGDAGKTATKRTASKRTATKRTASKPAASKRASAKR